MESVKLVGYRLDPGIPCATIHGSDPNRIGQDESLGI